MSCVIERDSTRKRPAAAPARSPGGTVLRRAEKRLSRIEFVPLLTSPPFQRDSKVDPGKA
jgi:hypothetical protein